MKRSNCAMSKRCLGHFDGIDQSLACILAKKLGARGGKYPMKTPENALCETLNFKMSLGSQELEHNNNNNLYFKRVTPITMKYSP